MSVISMKQLLEAGVHFGHQTRKWNPKMKKYIFTARNDIHIINLEDTSVLIDNAYNFVRDCVAQGKNVLFVGTKKQAQDAVKEEAERCGMFYVNTRWLGGTLTNYKTIKLRIERLAKLNQMEKVGEFNLLPKKEVSLLKIERDKLEKNLGGIKEMHDIPGVMFIVDPSKEHICVREANNLNIPIVGLVDTNCDPTGISYVIPGNDDAIRSVKLIASAIADAVIEAREGVAAVKKENEEDEKVDLNAVLAEMKTVKDIEDKEEDTKKKSFKKPSKVAKPEAVKEEVKEPAKEDIKEEAKEEVKEVKVVKAKAVKTEEEKAEPAKKAVKKTASKVDDAPKKAKTAKKEEKGE